MKKLLLFLFAVGLAISCDSQTKQEKFSWKEFVSKQANFKVKTPCELQEVAKSSENQMQSVKTYTYACKTEDYRVFTNFTEYLSKFGEEESRRNLPHMPDDLRGTFPNITSIVTKEIVKNGDMGNVSEYKLSNNDRIKNFFLIDNHGIYNIVIYVSRKENQTDNDFDDYCKSLTEPIIESFEIIKNK